MADRDSTLRLEVVTDRCIGSGMCEMLEEAVFEVDEEHFVAKVLGSGVLARDRAAVVIDRCPAGAIVVVDEPGELH